MVDPHHFSSYTALAILAASSALYYSYHNVSIDTIPVTERRRLRFVGPKLSSIISEYSISAILDEYKSEGALIEEDSKHEVRNAAEVISLLLTKLLCVR